MNDFISHGKKKEQWDKATILFKQKSFLLKITKTSYCFNIAKY